MSAIPVACLVLIDEDGYILATKRPYDKALGGLWEFPGGKIEGDETPEEALRRELQEELCLPVISVTPLTPVTHTYNFGTIELHPFLARCDTRPLIHLIEHIAFCWVAIKDIKALPWAAADVPIIKELENLPEIAPPA